MDILESLTPARLPSYTIVCDNADPQNPCLVPSTLASSPAATGLLLLGTGRESRKDIKAHYRPVAKRQRLKVVIEVKVPIAQSERLAQANEDEDYERRNWRLEAVRRVGGRVWSCAVLVIVMGYCLSGLCRPSLLWLRSRISFIISSRRSKFGTTTNLPRFRNPLFNILKKLLRLLQSLYTALVLSPKKTESSIEHTAK